MPLSLHDVTFSSYLQLPRRPLGSDLFLFDYIHTAHPGAEYSRHHDRTVGLLVVFHHRDQRARESESRSIECVQETSPASIHRAILNIRTPRLEVAYI